MLRRMLRAAAKRSRAHLMLAGTLMAIAALVVPPQAFSQSCALCYTQAASAGARMIEALRSGILILIVPPTFMSVCMIFIVYNKRNQVRRDDDVHDPDRSW